MTVSSTPSSILNHFPTTSRHTTGVLDTVTTAAVMLSTEESSLRELVPDSQQGTVMMSAVERMIMAKLNSNGEKMDRLSTVMEKMESTMFGLQQENDRLKKEMTELKTKQEKTQSIAGLADYKATKAYQRSNFNEQYSRNYNLRIYYVQEPEGETAEQCEATVLKLFHEKLDLKHIRSRDLDTVHRLGKKTDQKKPRGIIVRFVSSKMRDEVIRSRTKLKKRPGQSTKSVVIVEDLTKDNYILFSQARVAEGTKECWTVRGNIFVKTNTDYVKRIQKASDIENLPAQPIKGSAQHSQKVVSGQGDRLWNLAERGKTRRGRDGGRGGGGKAVRGWSQKRNNVSQRESQNLCASDEEWESQCDSDDN